MKVFADVKVGVIVENNATRHIASLDINILPPEQNMVQMRLFGENNASYALLGKGGKTHKIYFPNKFSKIGNEYSLEVGDVKFFKENSNEEEFRKNLTTYIEVLDKKGHYHAHGHYSYSRLARSFERHPVMYSPRLVFGPLKEKGEIIFYINVTDKDIEVKHNNHSLKN